MNIQRTEQYDIVVIGGGPAGACAALAAARTKKRVVLVEKYGFLGGVGTASLFSPLRGFYSGTKKVIAGIADEIVERLKALHGSPGHVPEGDTMVTPFDGEVMKYVLQEMLLESGASLLFHAECIHVNRMNSRLESVILHCREGLVKVRAKTFIDATGTGEMAVAANVKHVRNPAAASYRFSMTNVDVPALFQWVQEQKHEFTAIVPMENTYFSLHGFTTLAKEWSAAQPALSPINAIELTADSVPGNVLVNMISLPAVDPSRVESVSAAGLLVQTMPTEAAHYLQKAVPGFSSARILVTPPQFGFHSPRRMEGIIPLSFAKVMSGESYYDSVGTFAMPGKSNQTFQVSKRSMKPAGIENLLITGRAILPMTTLFSTNNQPASMRLGESAGLIAASM